MGAEEPTQFWLPVFMLLSLLLFGLSFEVWGRIPIKLNCITQAAQADVFVHVVARVLIQL